MNRRATRVAWVLLALAVLAVYRIWLPEEHALHPATPQAGEAPAATSGMPALARLPAEEQTAVGATLALIRAGGPFPHRQDGAEFQNREGQLPAAAPGYYREFTVETPGSPDRGARRIVTGRGGEVYYTSDHYRSFRRLE